MTAYRRIANIAAGGDFRPLMSLNDPNTTSTGHTISTVITPGIRLSLAIYK